MAAQETKKPKLRVATVHSGEDPATAQAVDVSKLPVIERVLPKPKALFVVHGMGQQLRFETLDRMVNGLFEQDSENSGSEYKAAAMARHVELGTERLERMEIKLRASGGAPVHEVHIYEAYW